jgi:uncharacterized protein involved in exopolysaccharide biosynthesis
LDQYRTRVENTPKNEQEFQELTRDYESTKDLYQNLSKRYDEAQLAESMEQHQKGEQFRIIDPAVPPTSPTAPRRARLLLVSVAVSLMLGVGVMVISEVLDTSFHAVADLRTYVSVPVLVSIPSIVTEFDVRRRRWRFRLAAACVVVGILVVATSAYLFAHGNEYLAQLLSRANRA